MGSQIFTLLTNGNIRAKQVAHYLGVYISTVWCYARRPDFPKPHRLIDGVTVFDVTAIRQWNKRKTGGENAQRDREHTLYGSRSTSTIYGSGSRLNTQPLEFFALQGFHSIS